MPMPQYNGPMYSQGPNPNAYYGCQQNCYQSCGC